MLTEWGYLWSQWDRMNKELQGEAKEKLRPRERALIGAFDQEIREVLRELEELEEKIRVGAPNPPAYRDVFKSILNKLYTVASSGPTAAGQLPAALLNRLWSSALEAFTGFLERQGSALQVEGWSIGASFGFPAGVSGTLTVNFRAQSFKK